MSRVVGLRILLCLVLGLDGQILLVHGYPDAPKFRRNRRFQCPVPPSAFQDPSVSVHSPHPHPPHPLHPGASRSPPPNPGSLQSWVSPPQIPRPHPPPAQQIHTSSTS